MFSLTREESYCRHSAERTAETFAFIQPTNRGKGSMPQTGMSKIWEQTSQQVTSTELMADKLLELIELNQILQRPP
jgi:hypothetical protein